MRVGDRVMALLAGGGYAEQVTVPERQTLPIPSGLEVTAAAAVPEAFLTAYEALFNVARLASAEWVLVHAAAGGVGSGAIQLAKASGARVIATTSGGAKADFCASARRRSRRRLPERRLRRRCSRRDGRFGRRRRPRFRRRRLRRASSRVASASRGRHVVVGLLGGARASLDLGRLLDEAPYPRRRRDADALARTRPRSSRASGAAFCRCSRRGASAPCSTASTCSKT